MLTFESGYGRRGLRVQIARLVAHAEFNWYCARQPKFRHLLAVSATLNREYALLHLELMGVRLEFIAALYPKATP